jgi:chromosome segregation ATPase
MNEEKKPLSITLVRTSTQSNWKARPNNTNPLTVVNNEVAASSSPSSNDNTERGMVTLKKRKFREISPETNIVPMVDDVNIKDTINENITLKLTNKSLTDEVEFLKTVTGDITLSNDDMIKNLYINAEKYAQQLITEWEKQSKKQNEELSKLASQLNFEKEAIDRKVESVKVLTIKANDLEKTNDELKDAVEIAESNEQMLHEQIDQLKVEINKEKENSLELETIKGKVLALEEDKSQYESEKQGIEKNALDLQSENEKLKIINSANEKIIDSLKQELLVLPTVVNKPVVVDFTQTEMYLKLQETVSGLNQTIISLKGREVQHEEEMRNLKDDHKQAINKLKGRNKALGKKIDEANKTISETKAMYTEKESEFKKLQIESNRKETKTLLLKQNEESLIKKKEKEVEAQKLLLTEVTEAHESVLSEKINLELTNRSLTRERDEAKKEKEALQAKLDEELEYKKQLGISIEDLKKKNTALENKEKEKKRVLLLENEKKEDLTEKIDELEKENESLKIELKEATKKKLTITNTTSTESDGLKEINESIEKLNTKNNELTEERNRLERNNKSLERKVKQLQESKKDMVLCTVNTKLQDDLRKVQTENEDLRKKHKLTLEDKKNTVEQLQLKLEEALKEVDKNDISNSIVVMKKNDIQSKLEEYKKRTKELESTVQSQTEELEKLNEETSNLRAIKDDIEKEKNGTLVLLKTQKSELEIIIDKLKNDITLVQEDLDINKEELSQAKQKVIEYKTLKIDYDNLKLNDTQTKRQLINYEATLAEKILAEAALEDEKKAKALALRESIESTKKYELALVEKEQKEDLVVDLTEKVETNTKALEDVKKQLKLTSAEKERYYTALDQAQKEVLSIKTAQIEKKRELALEYTQLTNETKRIKTLYVQAREEIVSLKSNPTSSNEFVQKIQQELLSSKSKISDLESQLAIVEKKQPQPSLPPMVVVPKPDQTLIDAQKLINTQEKQLKAYYNMIILEFDLNDIAKLRPYQGVIPSQVLVCSDSKRMEILTGCLKFYKTLGLSKVTNAVNGAFTRTLQEVDDSDDIVIFEKGSLNTTTTTTTTTKKTPVKQPQIQKPLIIGTPSYTSSYGNSGLASLSKSLYASLFSHKKDIRGRYDIHLNFNDSFETKVKYLHLLTYQDSHFYVIDFTKMPQGNQQKIVTKYTPNTVQYNGFLRISISDKSLYESQTVEMKYLIANEKTVVGKDSVILFTHELTPFLHKLDLMVIAK